MFSLGNLLGAVLRSIFGALTDYLRDRRRDKALEVKGQHRSLKERIEVEKAVNTSVRNIRHKLRTDSEFRERVLNEYRKHHKSE